MKYLLIAEKNSAMRQIQDCYMCHKSEITAKIGGEIDFVALSGHLCQWLEPKDYPQWQEKWSELKLPMIPDPFVIKPIPAKYQMEKLEDLKKRVQSGKIDKYIVATDPDFEGSGIAYLVAKYLKFDDKPTLRFFEQSLTDDEIISAFYNMTDFYSYPRDVRSIERFLIRSKFDWITGMNATIGMTVKSGELMRVGRVKAPTLKLVYDNSMSIDNFSKTESFKVKVNYMEGFSGFMLDEAGDELEKDTEEQARSICDMLADENEAKVTRIERKLNKNSPKQFYKLSSVQVDAGQRYNYSPTEVLEYIQKCYEAGYLGYPRTEGSVISTAKAKEIPDLLSGLGRIPELKPYVEKITDNDIRALTANKKYVDDEEKARSNHEALLPTKKIPNIDSLPKGQRDVYLLVAKRFIAAFYPPELKNKTKLWTDIAGKPFYSEGTSVKDPGWKAVYSDGLTDSEEEMPNPIPEDLQEGDFVFSETFEPYKKIPKPPARYTESTLVGAMENIAKFIDDEDLKKALKGGIGTQATRATIIKELIDTKYIRSEPPKNKLYITDLGKRYVEKLSPFSIIRPEEAARWETVFKSVGEGSISYPDAEKAIVGYSMALTDEINNAQIEKTAPVDENGKPKVLTGGALEGLKCPYCGADIKGLKFSYVCSNNMNKTCSFNVRHLDGKVKPEDIRKLIETGKTRIIANVCQGKNGKSYDARLVLKPKGEKFTTGFEFPEKKREVVVDE